MIISHKHKFIFVKTMKTAGTSIEVYLSQHCGDKDTVTPIWPLVEPHRSRNFKGFFNPLPEIIENKGGGIKVIIDNVIKKRKFYNHIPAKLVKYRVSRIIWDSYFKFCVERNPWDKTLSHYHWVNRQADSKLSLEEYIRKGSFCLNYPIYCDFNDYILVDKVIKYESLVDELVDVFQELGIPFNGSLGVRAKSEQRKDKRPYQEVFSLEQRCVIEKAFEKEIEMHDYIF